MKSDLRCLLEDLSTYLALVGKRPPQLAGPHEALLGRSQALVAALHPRSMRLRLAACLDETPSTRTLRFERVDGPVPPFRPGQYVSLTVQIGAVTTTRPYSISSRPGLDHLDLTVKDEPGGFVAPFLLRQVPGWEVASSGPVGSFVYDPLRDRGPLVLIAGGSGITPFMSMVRHFSQIGFPAPVQLLHASRSIDDVLFGDELAALAAEHDAFGALSIVSRPPKGYRGPAGHIDAARIAAEVGDVAGRSFFVCGPPSMIESVVGALASLDVPRHALRRESYGPPRDVTASPGWPGDVAAGDEFEVEVRGGGRFDVRADEPLLNALERAGLALPSVCRTGECAECRVRVVAGRAWSLPDAGLREADAAQGFVHACVAYATSDLRVDTGR